MNNRRTLASTLLALSLSTVGAFFAPSQAADKFCPNPAAPAPVHLRLKPLGDLISKGEGDYNAVNRGYAGDTPGGIQGLTGKTFENYTVGQVIAYQRRWLFAVGRYQFIPTTLRFAVAHSSVDNLDMFTPDIQDKLMAALVLYKRPAVGAYLRGDHNLIEWATNELAYEWASIEYRYGRGYYDHVGGNRAHVTREEVRTVLLQVKEHWHKPQGPLS